VTTDTRSGRGYEYGGLLVGLGAGFVMMGLIAAIASR
jgi:hypothetical protein